MEKIEMQPWDHIVSHLSKPGDWCVRSSGTNAKRLLFVITKVDEKNVRELKLVYIENLKGWTLMDVKNVNRNNNELITYGSIHELLSSESSFCQKMNLRNPINRPNYLLNDENLKITNIKLGEGHYAEVLKGMLKVGDEEISVAVKRCLQVDKVSITDKRSTKDIIRIKLAKSQMIAEARLVCDFMHENIIKIYGVACNSAPVKVVMEYCPGGSLKNLLIKHKETIKNEERNIFLFEAAKALRHLQLKKCVHRWDVAARNCLIGNNGSLKLSDFGLSRRLEDLKKLSSDDENIAWPIPWMAPETLSKKPKFTTKSDVYAFGILIYEVYSCGGKPWPDITVVQDIIPLVRKGRIMATPSLLNDKNVEEIMHQCWKRKAVQRPDFIEIVKRFRTVLQSQKLPAGQDRIVSMLEGIDSSKNSINLEENSPDSTLSKQYKEDEKAAQKIAETIEETSTTLTKGETQASAPTLETCSKDMKIKKQKSSAIRSTPLTPGKWHRESKPSPSTISSKSSRTSSRKHFDTLIRSMAPRHKTRLSRYQNRNKQTKDKPPSHDKV
ncbi:Protein kinase domain containing protein [Brugia malayi]|uniref:Bm11054, isoform a n=2 Tax=Brugia malayi TaxID=6279 RepID=A0A0K0IQG4_BRUMA|nr:Protein kinase domain containing protein [Brugia malayi]CDQ01085.1 Bm11054, isoform a [Brugia malayi]VIO99262.1 Protein kinase domain containing protein [Brugia malayi]